MTIVITNILHKYLTNMFCVTVTVTLTLRFQMCQKLIVNTL